MGDRITQTVRGRAHVVGMIGRVDGDVDFAVDAPPPRPSVDDLPALLDTLRRDVAAGRERGEIDDDRAEAIVATVDEAARALPVTDTGSGSRFVAAMLRAKGLVGGLADLTAKVGEAISAVQGVL